MLGQALTLDLLASASAMAGRHTLAARLMGMAGASWHALGDIRFGSTRFRERLQGARAATRAALGGAAFAAAYRSGQQAAADNPGQVIPELDQDLPVRAKPGPATALTPREREVAELVAQGMSNREIAEKLVVAIRTAESHVENILRKLQFTSRAQVAVWYAEHGRET
jgi:non-specific serine/threonine protein kinase